MEDAASTEAVSEDTESLIDENVVRSVRKKTAEKTKGRKKGIETVVQKSSKKKKIPSKKTKSVKTGRSKKSKTLRESEDDVDAAFADKITIKDDNTFECRLCQVFITSVKLLAKSHATSCGGVKKKVGRHAKRIICSDCGESFTGKAALITHTAESHISPSYQCTVCMKRFKNRVYFRRHIKRHDPVTAVVCEFCPKTFKFECYKKRHMEICRKKLLNRSMAGMTKAGDDTETIIEVALDERREGDQTTLPNTEKLRTSPYQSFFNTLGFLNQQEWEDWLLTSQFRDAESAPFSRWLQ